MAMIQLNALRLNAVDANIIALDGVRRRGSHAGAPPVVPDVPDVPEEPDVPTNPDVDENGYIIFEDAEVARICAESWGEGKGLTLQQATEVTSIGTVFNNNTSITSFNEFDKFTGVTSLGGSDNFTTAGTVGAFYGCTALRTIKFPSSLTAINGGALADTSALEVDVSIPNLATLGNNAFRASGIRRVLNLGRVSAIGKYGTLSYGGEGVFYGCPNLEVLILPATTASIPAATFYNCVAMEVAIVLADVPPSLGNYAFNSTGNYPIYVPDASVAAYREASGWSAYASRIFPISQLSSDNPDLYNEIKEYL